MTIGVTDLDICEGRGRVLFGEALERLRDLPDESVQTVVTSPPYWQLRDYGHPDQLGLEATPTEFVERLVGIFREVRRVLRADGTLWLNLGDTYVGGRNGGVGSSSLTSHRMKVSLELGRRCVGIELADRCSDEIESRLAGLQLPLVPEAV